MADIEEQFKLEQQMKGVDMDYFRELLFGVAGNLNKLDATFLPFPLPQAGRAGSGG